MSNTLKHVEPLYIYNEYVYIYIPYILYHLSHDSHMIFPQISGEDLQLPPRSRFLKTVPFTLMSSAWKPQRGRRELLRCFIVFKGKQTMQNVYRNHGIITYPEYHIGCWLSGPKTYWFVYIYRYIYIYTTYILYIYTYIYIVGQSF